MTPKRWRPMRKKSPPHACATCNNLLALLQYKYSLGKYWRLLTLPIVKLLAEVIFRTVKACPHYQTFECMLCLWLTNLVFAVSSNTRIGKQRGWNVIGKHTNCKWFAILIFITSYIGNRIEESRYFKANRVTESETNNRLRAQCMVNLRKFKICKQLLDV